ncbi:MAG: hypothetical protein ABW079_10580 [Sedimenticola sp.]
MTRLLILLPVIALTACGSEVSPPYLNYHDCQKQMTRKLLDLGESETKATMEARAHCRQLYNQ